MLPQALQAFLDETTPPQLWDNPGAVKNAPGLDGLYEAFLLSDRSRGFEGGEAVRAFYSLLQEHNKDIVYDEVDWVDFIAQSLGLSHEDAGVVLTDLIGR